MTKHRKALALYNMRTAVRSMVADNSLPIEKRRQIMNDYDSLSLHFSDCTKEMNRLVYGK